MKNLARQLYDQYFREAEATPRGVVAKLKTIVKQLDSALAMQIGHLKVGKKIFMYIFFFMKGTFIFLLGIPYSDLAKVICYYWLVELIFWNKQNYIHGLILKLC